MRLLLSLLFPTFFCTCAPSPPNAVNELPEAPKYTWPTDRPAKLIVDADTANEIDDLFAIAYLLTGEHPGFELVGLSSAQWFHAWSGDSTVYRSQQLNEALLALTSRETLPHPLGADLPMGKPWGGYDARDSPAARLIIDAAMNLPAGEKMAVLSIGAATNLASAIALQPALKERIVAYLLGFRYDFAGGFWNKDEYNIRRDLNAANFLLNAEGLELHIMPVSVAAAHTWSRATTFAQLDKAGQLGGYLRARWEDHGGPEATQWTMWDVALMQAFLQPGQATERSVATPPENDQRRIWMYEQIDAVTMESNYWKRLIR